MKKAILLFLVATICYNAIAQNEAIKMGKPYTTKKEFKNYLKYDNQQHYILLGHYFFNNYSVLKTDDDFNPIAEVSLEANEEGMTVYEPKVCKGKIFSVVSAWSGKGKEIDYKLLLFDNDIKVEKQIDLARFQLAKKKRTPDMKVVLSSDSSKILVLFFGVDEETKQTATTMIAFNQNFEKLFEKEYQFNVSGNMGDLEDYLISPNGDVYFLMKEYQGDKKKEYTKSKGDKIVAYEKRIYKFTNAQEPTIFNLQLPQGHIISTNLVFNKYNKNYDVYCVGTWSESFNNIDGLYYLHLNEAGKVLQSKQINFTSEQIESIKAQGANTYKKKKVEGTGVSNFFVLKNATFRNDNSLNVALELSYTYTVSNGKYSYTLLVTNNILNFSFKPDGELGYMKILPKSEDFSDWSLCGATVIEANNNIYFLYNDNEDDIDKDINEGYQAKRNNEIKHLVAVLTELQKDGTLKRVPLFNRTKDQKNLLMAESGVLYAPNKIFIAAKDTGGFFNIGPKKTIQFIAIKL